MVMMVLLGALEGALIAGLLWLLMPHRLTLLDQLERFEARPGRSASSGERQTDRRFALLQKEIGSRVAAWLAARGISYQSLRQNLALTGTTFEQILALKTVGFAAGFLLGTSGGLTLRAAHVPMPVVGPVASGLGLGVALFFLPDLYVQREAVARRRQFRRALGSWLDLVALEMAASAAPAEALPAAARIGDSWPIIVIRQTLQRATLSGEDHWHALTDLGARLGVHELTDLATLTRLVGRDGAQVRDTLTARASTMRRNLLADAQSEAGRQDQSMLVAQILIGFGFILFVMYPAIINVMGL